MPKYQLRFAAERPRDMEVCLQLAVATSQDEVVAALGGHPCSYGRHKYLRQTFTTVYVAICNQVCDARADFVKCACQSERAAFVQSLVNPALAIARPRSGPQSRTIRRRGVPKRSAKAKATIATRDREPSMEEACEAEPERAGDLGGLPVARAARKRPRSSSSDECKSGERAPSLEGSVVCSEDEAGVRSEASGVYEHACPHGVKVLKSRKKKMCSGCGRTNAEGMAWVCAR